MTNSGEIKVYPGNPKEKKKVRKDIVPTTRPQEHLPTYLPSEEKG